MNIREEIKQYLDEQEIEVAIYEGCDDAIIGIGRVHTKGTRIVYCYNKLVEIHMEDGDTTRLEAIATVDRNMSNAYIGDTTPLIVDKCFLCCK